LGRRRMLLTGLTPPGSHEHDVLNLNAR
jgi:hypothetical protein